MISLSADARATFFAAIGDVAILQPGQHQAQGRDALLVRAFIAIFRESLSRSRNPIRARPSWPPVQIPQFRNGRMAKTSARAAAGAAEIKFPALVGQGVQPRHTIDAAPRFEPPCRETTMRFMLLMIPRGYEKALRRRCPIRRMSPK